MGGCQWRSWARFAAYFDLILKGIFAIICGLFINVLFVVTITAIFGYTPVAYDVLSIEEKEHLPSLAGCFGITWATAVILDLMIIAEFLAAMQLMKGTEMGRKTSEALDMCTTWCNATIVFFLRDSILTVVLFSIFFFLRDWLLTVGLTYAFEWIMFVTGVMSVIRVVLFFLVSTFMMELEMSRNSMPKPTGFAV